MNSSDGRTISDGRQALAYARELSFPRRTGTEGESKAAQTIIRILRELGYDPLTEDFSIRLPPWVWLKGLPFFSCLTLLVIGLVYEASPFVAFLFSLLFVLGVGVWDRFWLSGGGRVVSEDRRKGLRSMNISASLPGRGGGRPLYLMAHYDSKSQPVSLYVRTGLFLLGTACGGLFCLWVSIHFFQGWIGNRNDAIPFSLQLTFFLSLILNLFFVVSKTGNRSEGSVDNASGVGVLLEIARIWPSKNITGIDLRFVFTGAEELGLLGSLMFQRRWGERMVREGASLINVDSVGGRGKLRICASAGAGKKLRKEIVAAASEMRIPIRPLRFYRGVMMDHLPFVRLGIPAISLTSISTEGWHLHTPGDTFSLLQEEGLAEAIRIIFALISSPKGAPEN